MTRVLVLGIDAANPALLERWAAEGALPALGELLRRSVVARTRGVEGFFVGSTWPSFSTGVGPARHGVHYLAQLRVGSYAYERVAERPEPCEPFWVRVSRAGGRVAVLDVPLSRLAPGLNGIQTIEWGSHDRLYGFQASPDRLGTEIASTFGTHPLGGSCDGARATAAAYEAFVERLVSGALLKGQLTRTLLSRERWELFVQVFSEAHCAGHQCWHFHDERHPSHDRRIALSIGDPLLRVYRAIDAAVGEVLAAAEDAIVLLVLAHGMAHHYGAQLLLPEILFRLGVAERPLWRPGSAARAAARRVWGTLPAGARRRLRPLRERVQSTSSGQLPRLGVDPGASRCFAVQNGLLVGGIRLNLAGREPAGRLRAGAEADRFCAELAEDLLAIVDPETRAPLVHRVVRTSERFFGPHLDDLPDLLVEWSDRGPLANTAVGPAAAARVRAASPKIGVVGGANHWGRTGEHRPEGLFAAVVPGARPGRIDDVELVDVARTVLQLLGIDAPDLDGRPVALVR